MSDHDKEHDEEKGHGGGHGGGGHGHGGGGHEEHEGVPEWMISFADNTALMMGLFVILLAMNMGPKATSVMGGDPSEKASYEAASSNNMLDLVISVRQAFNNPVDMNSTNPKEAAVRQRMMERMGANATKVTPDKDAARAGGAVRESEYNEVGARVDFDDASSLLSAAARQSVAETARQFGNTRYVIEIRGHASPFETFMNVEKGMKLAFDRAMAVANELASQGVRWGQMRVVACGDNERLVARTYNRAEDSTNQRAEIILTKDLVPGDNGVDRPRPAEKH